nr:PREDICTED: myoneurin [Latimeria chalumnae]|eukprot:XP_014342005.1 PREDICTED: myoneurin [Latimeria chalumnae]
MHCLSAMQHSHHCKQLLDQLNKQRETGFLCDCTVVIGQSQFKAHRNVLAAFSEYFGAFYKTTSDNTVVFLDQSQVKADGFQKLLDFIYTGNINLNSYDAADIHQVATYLQIEEVASKCEHTKHSPAGAVNCLSIEIQNRIESVEVGKQAGFFPLGDHSGHKELEMACMSPIQAASQRRENLGKGQPPREKGMKRAKKLGSSQGGGGGAPQHRRNGQARIRRRQGSSIKVLSPKALMESRKVITKMAEQVAQRDDGLDSQSVAVLNSESFLAPDKGLKNLTGKPKRGRSQRSCSLKENCAASGEKAEYLKVSGPEDPESKQLKHKPMCNTCGKVFSEASSLRRHMRIHKGVKPYICHLCGKAFTQCNQLKTHVRTHTGEKPYQCDLCEKGFAQKCQLVFHSRMHHGEEKPYKCDVCNLQFATSSNLKIHASSAEILWFLKFNKSTVVTGQLVGEHGLIFVLHFLSIGEKPYTCSICGKSFISSGELNKHFRSHTASDKKTDLKAASEPLTELELLQKDPLQDSLDLKPSDIPIPLTLPIETEDHQMLLPVTDSQSVSSETLLRSSMTGYPEPQFIFLQQLY